MGLEIPGKQDLLRNCQVTPKLSHLNNSYSHFSHKAFVWSQGYQRIKKTNMS